MAQESKIFRCLDFPRRAVILIYSHIQGLMEFTLNPTAFANCIKNASSIAGQTCDEVAQLFGVLLADSAYANDHSNTSWPNGLLHVYEDVT